jgi:hypothetical protein
MPVILWTSAIVALSTSAVRLAREDAVAEVEICYCASFGNNNAGAFVGGGDGKDKLHYSFHVFKIGVAEGGDSNLEEEIVRLEGLRGGDASDFVRLIVFNNLACQHGFWNPLDTHFCCAGFVIQKRLEVFRMTVCGAWRLVSGLAASLSEMRTASCATSNTTEGVQTGRMKNTFCKLNLDM